MDSRKSSSECLLPVSTPDTSTCSHSTGTLSALKIVLTDSETSAPIPSPIANVFSAYFLLYLCLGVSAEPRTWNQCDGILAAKLGWFEYIGIDSRRIGWMEELASGTTSRTGVCGHRAAIEGFAGHCDRALRSRACVDEMGQLQPLHSGILCVFT